MSLDHIARRKTLGASEIYAACGRSPYQTRKQLWAIKTGRAKPFGGNRHTKWGNIHEPQIANEYLSLLLEEDPHWYIVKPEGTQVNGKPWAATPDRLVYYGNSPKPSWLLEIKTASNDDEWGPSGSQEIPEGYLYQIQWQMYVCGMDRCDVAVLIGGNDYREYTFKRDPELIDKLIAGAEDFWGYVERDEEPPEEVKDDTPVIAATPDIASAIAEKVHNAKVRAEAEAGEKDARKRLIKLIPQGSKCSTDFGSAGWSERKGTTKTDWEAAFWDLTKDYTSHLIEDTAISDNKCLDIMREKAEQVIASRTNTTEPVWVLTVKGKK